MSSGGLTEQVVLRVEREIIALTERVAAAIAASAVTGKAPARAEIMRAALRRGLEQMLSEIEEPKRGKRGK